MSGMTSHGGGDRQPRTVFLTGGTGVWGRATLAEFARRDGQYRVIMLVRPGPSAGATIAAYRGQSWLTVLEGDFTDPAVVRAGVRDADVVLHVGAVVSPFADEHPQLAMRVNTVGIRNIVDAVLALPDPARVAVVGIGSVAEYGSRGPSVHWGRVGDPLRPSVFDGYAQSKVVAERLLIESGVPRWTWLRQTGILHDGIAATRDPIMTHAPLDGVLEWTSDEDSARLLVELCDPLVPDELWGAVWNIGGGAGWRLSNYEMIDRMVRSVGGPGIEAWYRRNWFALKNFHGLWFTDSDRLEGLVPHRQDTLDAAFARAGEAAGRGARLGARLPAWLIREVVMRRFVNSPRGTMHAIRTGDEAAIEASFGSRETWAAIGGWSEYQPARLSSTPAFLDHGYDTDLSDSTWDLGTLRGVAEFRGGRLDAEKMGGVSVALPWVCGEGHRFMASPRLVLRSGHWCPDCLVDTNGYERQAERNRFLAQVLD